MPSHPMHASAPLNADPQWYKDAVIYQLHIKSFFDANNDGIGDFAGLLAKLDYIVELGVDTIWLLPFYPSPRRDDGYDIADYRGVHRDYGTLADFRGLVAAAHARGLRIITELVINHTSDQHPWFQRARMAKPGSAARNFYVWSDDNQRYRDTRIIFIDSEKSNWTWDDEAKAYYWHRFYSHQPDLNFDNPRVLREVLSIMRFWLDLGVDGLRLDAVPYLVEREGTSNENLPETHAILKKIRATLDGTFTDRLLLAEANQWPEDAKEYFGSGDECHMAFHFPLMPRMYMAIAREDRFPITDIMRQTPPIPDTCQWAIFLRNHDELTLEMVTSAERDYLWEIYASDRRARLNLGIRRRLAPLLERDRRRIELMNSLLFSMPGTPVMYYGDEIGMGDNIHQGDRDGVRTPMQWTPDRNGGFSRADPERLVLPPIMSPLYGFEAVNVEAQSGDPHSILNWTRRMLALRRQHRAFGRGTLRFLYPGNNKILAYLREFDGELVLCVANLSKTTQAVELDLSDYRERVPVEMLGNSPFPNIGTLPYLLTLPPYGFYWFLLSESAKPPAWHSAPQQQMPEQLTLVMNNRLGYELTETSRQVLMAEVLPPYLARRRWFSAKGEVFHAARFAYAVPMPDASEIFFAEVDVDVGDRTERYALPAAIVWENTPLTPLAEQLSLARVRRGPRIGTLTDAFALEDFALSVLGALRSGTVLDSAAGKLHFNPEAQFENVAIGRPAVRWLTAEQSNSSLVLGDVSVLKLVRHIAPGIFPEAEMTRYLTRAGFRNTAALEGEVVRIDANGTPHTLLVLQHFVLNQGDAWSWTLDFLRRTVEDAALTGASAERFEQDLLAYVPLARAIGTRLGELHATLARPTEDEAFKPVRAAAADVLALERDLKDALDKALGRIAAHQTWASEAESSAALWLVGAAEALSAKVPELAARLGQSLLTRIHGDLHLGQILVAQSDAYLIDFEGEPARPLSERRAKSSPLRDVAGVLRSFDYAVATLRRTTHEAVPDAHTIRTRRDALLSQFANRAEASFLSGYRDVLASADFPWVDAGAEAGLIDVYLLAKASYEVAYEAAMRPGWIGLPTTGLAALAQRLLNLPPPEGATPSLPTTSSGDPDAR
jgi:maltose alpha-D-glucosyltransferase / alpha-amylase